MIRWSSFVQARRGAQKAVQKTGSSLRCRSLSSVAVEESSSEAEDACKYPHLFRPLDLGPDIGVLPNRALMGSMHTGLEGHSMPRWMVPILDRLSSDTTAHSPEHDLTQMAAYFARRAKGGVGLMVTGGISPNLEGWTGPFQLTAHIRTRNGTTQSRH